MNATGLIVSLVGALLAILIATLGYFIKKWIESVDATLTKHSKSISDNTSEIISFKQAQSSQTANISEAVQAKLTAFQLSYSKIDKIEQEVCGLREVVQRKVLPQLEKQNEHLGKVIVLETQLKDQELKMIKLYEVLRRLAQKP